MSSVGRLGQIPVLHQLPGWGMMYWVARAGGGPLWGTGTGIRGGDLVTVGGLPIVCLSCLHSIAVCVPAPFSVGDKQPMILKWRILSATNDLDRVSAVALPKLPISLTNTDLKVASDTQFYPGLGMVVSELPLVSSQFLTFRIRQAQRAVRLADGKLLL